MMGNSRMTSLKALDLCAMQTVIRMKADGTEA